MVDPISTLANIFGIASGIESVLEYLDLVESKLDIILQAKLNAAVTALEDAVTSRSRNNFHKDIERALWLFGEAIEQEKDYRKVVAYIGYATCHANRKDRDLAIAYKYLRKALEVEFSRRLSISANEYKRLWRDMLGFMPASFAMLGTIALGSFIFPPLAPFLAVAGQGVFTGGMGYIYGRGFSRLVGGAVKGKPVFYEKPNALRDIKKIEETEVREYFLMIFLQSEIYALLKSKNQLQSSLS